MISKGQRGFTLIELLVVIAIIGILSSVVLASLNTARQKSRDARRISDIKQLQLACELYYDNNGQYPDGLTDANLVTPGYIAQIPKDPQTGNSYQYAYNGDRSNYHVGVTLENTNHQVFDNDVDFDSATAGWTGGFSGADPMYDMQP